MYFSIFYFFFFFNDTATTEIYTLSLHDALPIWLTPDTNPQPPADPASCSPAPASLAASPAPSDTSTPNGNTRSTDRADSDPSPCPVRRHPRRISSGEYRPKPTRDAPPHYLLDPGSTAANRAALDRDAPECAPSHRQSS